MIARQKYLDTSCHQTTAHFGRHMLLSKVIRIPVHTHVRVTQLGTDYVAYVHIED